MQRIRFEVLPADDGSWDVTRDSIVVANFPVKSLAVQAAADRGRIAWEKGQLAQLLIKRRDGQIQDERTYGEDPADIPG